MHRILAAVDLSDSTQPVLRYAVDLARAENAKVSAVYAVPSRMAVHALAPTGGLAMVDTLEDEESELNSSLGQLQLSAKENGLAADDCLCVRGSAAETIRRAAEQLHADLIVTGSHGHGRFFHAMVGSVREALIAHAPCPVLVVPSHAASP